MSNLQIKKQTSKLNQLAIAHNALKAATKPKRVYTVEDFTNGYSAVVVDFYDQDENWHIKTISKNDLHGFINNDYSKIRDTEVCGDHVQYEDTTSTEQYLEDNLTEVLTQYLNSKYHA